MRLNRFDCFKFKDSNLLNRTYNSHKNYSNTMHLITIFTFLLFTLTNAIYHPDINAIQQPPHIFKGPGYEQLFQVNNGGEKSDKPFSLECEGKYFNFLCNRFAIKFINF